MNDRYVGHHRAPERTNTLSPSARFISAASAVVLSATLSGSSNQAERPVVAPPQKSIFDMSCEEADHTAIVDQHGRETVVVRLDCVPNGKASEYGAAVLHLTETNKSRIIPITRQPDHSVLQATCRKTLQGDEALNAEFEGEGQEWVKIVNTTYISGLDGMHFIDQHPVDKYVNSSYVVGEISLPACDAMQA